MGNMSTDRNPRSDVAHDTPRAEYTAQDVSKEDLCFQPQSQTKARKHLLCTVNSGNTAPSVYLKIPFAAIAEAPLSGP